MEETRSNSQLVSSSLAEPVYHEDLVIPNEQSGRTASDELLACLWLLWDRRRLLAKAGLCGLIVTAILSFIVPQKFESTVRFVPEQSASGSKSSVLAAMAGSRSDAPLTGLAADLFAMKTPAAYFVGLAASRTVQDWIVNKFDLRKVYGTRYMVDARKGLEKRTKILEDRKSGIISLTVTDSDPTRAAAIANAYVEELNQRSVDLNVSAAHRERAFLENRLKSIKVDLDSAEKALSEFSSKNATLDIKEQAKATLTSAALLQGQLIAAQSEIKGLEQIYAPDNARVRAARARSDELQRQLGLLGGSASSSKGLPDSDFPSIRKLPFIAVEYSELYRQAKVQETVFELLTQAYELAKVDEARETASVRFVDSAEVPERHSFPPRKVMTLLGGLLCISVVAGWILLKALWHDVRPQHPYRLFVEEVWLTAATNVGRLHRNVSFDSHTGGSNQ
jgi:uncharacterized protein involved in exopolysaccharide biosynthesis